MILLLLLQLSILAIAGFVTYASVYGLGVLFASVAVPVMIAGVALEAGKYVAVSYAYLQWRTMNRLERVLLVSFVTLMMAFTSAGVFAYLGQGYQSSFAVVNKDKADLEQLDTEVFDVRTRIAALDKQIEQLPTNSVSGRIRLSKAFETERTALKSQEAALVKRVDDLRSKISTTEIHVGPIAYMARAFGVSIETAATWAIVSLTVCLDPFALFLTLLMNKVRLLRKQELEDRVKLPKLYPGYKDTTADPEPAPEASDKWAFQYGDPEPQLEPEEKAEASSPQQDAVDAATESPAPAVVADPPAVEPTKPKPTKRVSAKQAPPKPVKAPKPKSKTSKATPWDDDSDSTPAADARRTKPEPPTVIEREK